MAKTDKERKQKQRDREAAMGMKNFTMRITKNERQDIANGAGRNGFEDQTEYLMHLVYRDKSQSQQESKS